MVENLPANTGDIRDVGPIPGSGRSPGGGHSNLLQFSCLENPHGQRSLVSYSPGIAKSQTQLTWPSTHTSSGKCCVAVLHKASEQVKVGQSSLTLCDPRTVVCQASLSMGFSR